MADLDVAVTLKFLTTGADKLKTAARDLQAFGKIGNKATGRFGGDMTKAWTASVKLGGALNKSAGAANKTAAAIRSIGGSAAGIDKTRAAVDRLTKSTSAAAVNAKKMRSGALGAAMLGGGAMGRRAKMREGLAEAASRITPEGYLLGASGAVMAGAALGGTVAGGLAGVAIATKEAIDRNKSFASIMKKVTLEGGENFDTLDRKIRNVSTSIGMSYSDAAAIFAQGGQGNVAYKDLENFAMLGAKVSTAWDISARDAAQMLTEVKASTSWSIPQLQEFADKVNGLGDVSAAAEKDVGVMFQRAAAGAKAAGVTFDQSLGFMTGLRSVGMQEEVAARFFGAFSSKLRGATSLSKDAQGAFKELGMSAANIEKGMSMDAAGTMTKLLGKLASSKNNIKLTGAIFGEQWRDEVVLMQQALPEIARLLDYIGSGKWKGSTDKALEFDLGTTEAKLNKLKQSVLDIMSELAKPALPWLNSFADKAADVAKNMREANQRSEDSRKSVKPVGSSVLDYEKRVGLVQETKPAPPMFHTIPGAGLSKGAGWAVSADAGPMGVRGGIAASATPAFRRMSGSVPSIDVSALDASKAKINEAETAFFKLTEAAKSASTASNFTASPNIDVGAAISNLDALAAKAAAVSASIRSFSIISPTISGGSPAPTGGGGAPANPSAAGKQGSVAAPIHIGQAHFHGVKDAGSLHRQLAVLQNRSIRTARDGALHDIA